jgi:hypothetical protein
MLEKIMNKFKKDVLNDLMELVDKIVDHEIQEGQKVIPDEVLVHISYAMEQLAGIAGFTNEVIKENKPGYLKDRNN